MNSAQEIHYNLLNLLAAEPQLGQREMARKMGISLGKVNYCIAELSKKGFIKVKRFQKARAKKACPFGKPAQGEFFKFFLKGRKRRAVIPVIRRLLLL